MQQILVYSDSLSWGIVPGTRNRLSFAERWPNVLEKNLNQQGRSVRVIEDCLNGRRTFCDDPLKPGRNALTGLAQTIEKHSPLELIIVMLGLNDFQSDLELLAANSANGIGLIVKEIREAPLEPGQPTAPILIVCPPIIQSPQGEMVEKFKGAEKKCQGLVAAYSAVALQNGAGFFDANLGIKCSEIDGIHLDARSHLALGQSLCEPVKNLLDRQ